MQIKLLHIFTEKDIDKNFFIKSVQDTENAVVFMIKNGECKILLENESISLGKNSIAFVEPKDYLVTEQITENFQVDILVYKKSFLAEVNIKLNKLKIFKYFSKYFREFSNFPDEEMELLLKQIDSIKYLLDYKDNIGFDEKVLENLFSAFIYTITGIYLQKDFFEQHKMSRADEITFQFSKNVFRNCIEEKSPQYYADLQNITSRHLTTMVKTVTGKTATQIIAEFVMNEAKILLNSTDKTVMEIADDLNFSDSYSFSHYFKRYEGQSPAHFRQTEI